MKIAAIIAEYNPFHNGHKYHIEQTKKLTGADYIIIIMSGNYIQRGEPAIIDKYSRTSMALSSGADLVLELPTCFSTASAEYFAYGAISILDKLNCIDYLCFGSESLDLEILKIVANILIHPNEFFSTQLNSYLKLGNSYPKARHLALVDYLKSTNHKYTKEIIEVLTSPNNILAIEYLKSLIKLNSSIKPINILREDNGFNNTNLANTTDFTSATSLRTYINQTGTSQRDNISNTQYILEHSKLNTIKKYMPLASYSILQKNYNSSCPIFFDDFTSLAYYNILNYSISDLTNFVDVDDNIANKLKNQLHDFSKISDLLTRLKTKDYTYTRLSRALLHIILNIKDEDFNILKTQAPEYVRILGFNSEKSSILKSIKKKTHIALITKRSLSKKILSVHSKKSLELDINSSELYNKIIELKFNNKLENEYKIKPKMK